MYFNLHVSHHGILAHSPSQFRIHVLSKHSFGWISCVANEAVLILYAKWIPMKGFYQLNCISSTVNGEVFSSFIPAFNEDNFVLCIAPHSRSMFFLLLCLALKFHRNSIAGLKIRSKYLHEYSGLGVARCFYLSNNNNQASSKNTNVTPKDNAQQNIRCFKEFDFLFLWIWTVWILCRVHCANFIIMC